jgi:hypothetical protein
MPVMILLALAHISFWGVGISLAFQQGTIGVVGALAIAIWLVVVGVWLAIIARISRLGWLSGPGVNALPWLWVPSPPVIVSLMGLLLVPIMREAWMAVLIALPAIALPALNTLRILAIGTIIKAWRVQFPRRIGFGVGIPDMLFGLWSGYIALSGGFVSRQQEFVWHIFGLVILLMMIPMVFTVLRQPRLDAIGKGPARAILVFPMVLAPAGLATMFAILHCLSLFRLLA